VVFFGASLTWGANATDQALSSYRAQTKEMLEARYPKARFLCYDAAIGGTGSQLGVFRLDLDVLARKPDLVFLDFSANDDNWNGSPLAFASYESLLRRIIRDGRAPVVAVMFPFKWEIAPGLESGSSKHLKGLARRMEIAAAYGVPTARCRNRRRQRAPDDSRRRQAASASRVLRYDQCPRDGAAGRGIRQTPHGVLHGWAPADRGTVPPR